MKRCPACRRDYTDETLNYCLDDGAVLVDGPSSGNEQVTAILGSKNENSVRVASPSTRRKAVLSALILTVLAGGLVGYWYLTRTNVKSSPFLSKNDSFLRAKVLVANENREDIDTAIGLLEQIVKDDPQYAAGWAQLSRAYTTKAFYFASDDQRKQISEDAEVAAERSLAIDPNLAEGHLARGLILWTHAKRFPHELAIQSYKRAIAIDPNLDEAHHQLALVYIHIGLFDKARAEIARTLEINPGNTLARFRYGVIDLYERKYDDALKFFKGVPSDQTAGIQAFQLATAEFKVGEIDEADALIDSYLRANPRDEGGVATSMKAMILAKKGRFDEAEENIKRAYEIGHEFGHFHHAAFNLASAYALMDKPDQALYYLQLAADDGFPCYPLFAEDESFVNMRQNAHFAALLSKLKQQWETYNATL